MAITNIMTAHAEVVALIFSFIILEENSFTAFARLFMVWQMKRPSSEIRFVLEKLPWDRLYQFHQYPMEVTRDQFHGFIDYCVRHQVSQAQFYNSSQMLFLKVDVNHHLGVLSDLSGNHFPSAFSFLFFNAIYRPFEIDFTARQMFPIVNNTFLRLKLQEIMLLLEDMYSYLFQNDYLLPVYKFCPNARDKDPIYQTHGHPLGEELWYSLCEETVEADYREEGHNHGKLLKLRHIWNTRCEHCALQLILFRVLLNAVSD